jgi:rSAM/selenodomain-associated transferase 2
VNLSVIIPVIHEESIINAAIQRLRAMPLGNSVEILVVDGCEDGSTIKEINDKTVKTVRSLPGRGRQMNKGAEESQSDFLLFLHADTILPEKALALIVGTLSENKIMGGAFDLTIDGRGFAYRLIEKVGSWRSRLSRIPYGDQAIFVRKDSFRSLGGFKDIPLMEDVDFMQRVKKNGGKIYIFKQPVKTSARRWQKEGVVRGTLRNWLLIVLYLSGVSPEKLARWYSFNK